MFKPRSQFVNVSWLLLLLCMCVCLCVLSWACLFIYKCILFFFLWVCVVWVFIVDHCWDRCCVDSLLIAPLHELQLLIPNLEYSKHCRYDDICRQTLQSKHLSGQKTRRASNEMVKSSVGGELCSGRYWQEMGTILTVWTSLYAHLLISLKCGTVEQWLALLPSKSGRAWS